MAFGMRRQFAAWMPARAQSNWGGGAAMTTMMICPPSGRVRLASMLFLRLVTFYVHAEGLSWSKNGVKNTHINIACFLACLKAARVWSLLKSPESDSKMSSIKIPAFDYFAYVFDRCVDVCGCFLCASGSALRLIVFYIISLDMLTELTDGNSTHSGADVPYLNRGSQKCYIYGQV